ncbi:hypothetical protein EZV62_014684 [Acer yangbiense]|uniref:Phosphofructokinase domain-containing protein n=1 Tax=Acer yangbiense TaxID=1000413 RepID=A0A5C7HSU8_9ROSI|nr:hypothetical protein EZV62_014684 [Acer yangbiense]
MEGLSHAIAPKLAPLPPKAKTNFRCNGFGSVIVRSKIHPIRVSKRSRVVAEIQSDHRERLDFSDPDWKSKFQSDFEQRFNLPHITDVFQDAKPIPSTFCLRMRTPVSEEFADGYPSDENWQGYINNSDRVLLKTIVILKAPVKEAGVEFHFGQTTSLTGIRKLRSCLDLRMLCSFMLLNGRNAFKVHRAGPRKEIYFKPEEVKAAIVTCGGLCPGLNDVIRHIVITLEIYGVKKIVGIPFGYRGFRDSDLTEMPLSRKVVQNIHLSGGSLLGVSRGGPTVSEIVDTMEERGINMLFVLGGNGTHAGANAIHNECRKRRMRVAVVGVPKTIDNDILLMDKTFGFDTAVEEAQRAINSAYIEAHSAYHGIGIVKLMGRSSGFIAMHASLASGQIDICLIPELPFHLHGPHGVLTHLKYLIETKGSAVICVAEGAGQNLIQKTNATDASGNIVLGDIGVHIQQEVKKYFKEIGIPADVKYIDPTYMIRACRANASDGILCTVLGQNASNLKSEVTDMKTLMAGQIWNLDQLLSKLSLNLANSKPPFNWISARELASLAYVHGAFAGYSGITVGICNTHYVYVPIPEVISYPRAVDPNSRMWHRCLTSTGQPDF